MEDRVQNGECRMQNEKQRTEDGRQKTEDGRQENPKWFDKLTTTKSKQILIIKKIKTTRTDFAGGLSKSVVRISHWQYDLSINRG